VHNVPLIPALRAVRHPAWSSGQTGTGETVGFAGGERTPDEIDIAWQRNGARMYDPVLGRFLGVEPLADDYAYLSGYVYALNDPVNYTDATGMEPTNPGFSSDAWNQILSAWNHADSPSPPKPHKPIQGPRNIIDNSIDGVNGGGRGKWMPYTVDVFKPTHSISAFSTVHDAWLRTTYVTHSTQTRWVWVPDAQPASASLAGSVAIPYPPSWAPAAIETGWAVAVAEPTPFGEAVMTGVSTVYGLWWLAADISNRTTLSSSKYSSETKVTDILAQKKGSIKSQFPEQWKDKTWGEVEKAAAAGDKSAQTARKLLTDGRFNK
jgi:RHS repeat-associated protein